MARKSEKRVRQGPGTSAKAAETKSSSLKEWNMGKVRRILLCKEEEGIRGFGLCRGLGEV
ncbi:hypothetical protein CSW24_07290 [Thermus scotoductus]|nr:hypothetical protein CSW24_07290 [Thermus scotoductus]